MSWKEVCHHAITAVILIGMTFAVTNCFVRVQENNLRASQPERATE